ncbi:Lipopolysaccharide biosynthesis protein RffC [Cronobacter sakazakii 680]|nr:Lipopolysaccharide biosynthesis protein RffC [Cronobacter sakazakii 680]
MQAARHWCVTRGLYTLRVATQAATAPRCAAILPAAATSKAPLIGYTGNYHDPI